MTHVFFTSCACKIVTIFYHTVSRSLSYTVPLSEPVQNRIPVLLLEFIQVFRFFHSKTEQSNRTQIAFCLALVAAQMENPVQDLLDGNTTFNPSKQAVFQNMLIQLYFKISFGFPSHDHRFAPCDKHLHIPECIRGKEVTYSSHNLRSAAMCRIVYSCVTKRCLQ